MTEFEIKDYRQPLVTSLGVILGFFLGFLGQWITEDDFSLNLISEYVTLFGTVVGAGLLLYALYRMLSPVNPETARVYYARTLTIYMTGVLVPFISILAAAFV